MRLSESGKGTLKAIVALAFLAALTYAGVKVIRVYANNYALQDYIRQQNPFWLTQRATGEGVRNAILAKAQELDLPVSAEQVKVEATGAKVSVLVDYTVPVDLKVYTLTLHFSPSAENRAL